MIKRHENSLNNLLERVMNEGYGTVAKWRQMKWYEKEIFTSAVRRDLRERWGDLISEAGSAAGYEMTADWAGIRPHIFVDGQLHHDFHILHETESGCPGWINLLGMDSPGLTASMAVGPYVGGLL